MKSVQPYRLEYSGLVFYYLEGDLFIGTTDGYWHTRRTIIYSGITNLNHCLQYREAVIPVDGQAIKQC